MIRFVFFRAVCFLSSQLSLASQRRWGRRLGRFMNLFNPKLARAMGRNLKTIIEDPALRTKTADGSVQNFGMFLFEFLGGKTPSLEAVEDDVAVLWSALEEGRGAILLSVHMGNWEAGAQFVARRSGRPVVLIAETLGSARCDRLFDAIRRRNGVGVWRPASRSRDLFTALKAGGVVATAIEGPPVDEGIPVKFLGHDIKFSAGVFRLAQKMGAPILPTVFLRAGHDAYQIIAGEKILVPEGEEALLTSAQRTAGALSAFIAAAPEQWTLFLRRFSRD